jgi:hypothetical protein
MLKWNIHEVLDRYIESREHGNRRCGIDTNKESEHGARCKMEITSRGAEAWNEARVEMQVRTGTWRKMLDRYGEQEHGQEKC